jgi:hypothetical protein
MKETLETRVRRLTAESELVRAADVVRADGGVALALGGTALRALFKSEIAQLESLGNSAQDWFRVRVAEGFSPRRVRNCEFRGNVVLGACDEAVELAGGVEAETGLSNSTVVDCVVGNNASVRDVRLLANYVVCERAVVADCGRITCSPGTTFGNGARVPVALEGGGRDIEMFAELTVELAAAVVRPGTLRPELEGYRRAVAEYQARVTSKRGVIGAGARLWSVSRIEDSFVGPGSRIDGAACIVRSTLLGTADEPVVVESGAQVTDSLLQWGCRATGAAIVERSVLIEQARVERQGKVQCSVLGPNTEVAAGEVCSCLLGPFVGCHHQSLLISTLWPAGRGNVGYGANVGSNHTSRAPDQEFWAAEGLFIGLGVNVKFPCDFSRAPYTVIACGTDLSPQKVTFPFSLVAPPQERFEGAPPAFNQISPAWMLRENVYALKRNEAKFRARNRARRNRFDFAVFRRETVELMRAATRQLAEVREQKPLYTERDIPGLGKNVLTERDRVRAIEAYRFYTCFHGLLALRDEVRKALEEGRDAAQVLAVPGACDDWEQQRHILAQDFGIDDPAAGLRLMPQMAMQVAKDCERAREKDDTRGVRVIDDYPDVHPVADRDPVVRLAWEEADRLHDEVEGHLLRLAAKGAPASLRLGFPMAEGPVSVLRS